MKEKEIDNEQVHNHLLFSKKERATRAHMTQCSGGEDHTTHKRYVAYNSTNKKKGEKMAPSKKNQNNSADTTPRICFGVQVAPSFANALSLALDVFAFFFSFFHSPPSLDWIPRKWGNKEPVGAASLEVVPKKDTGKGNRGDNRRVKAPC